MVHRHIQILLYDYVRSLYYTTQNFDVADSQNKYAGERVQAIAHLSDERECRQFLCGGSNCKRKQPRSYLQESRLVLMDQTRTTQHQAALERQSSDMRIVGEDEVEDEMS
nr:hypothetical protein CFP56_72734 [Quercus suber]